MVETATKQADEDRTKLASPDEGGLTADELEKIAKRVELDPSLIPSVPLRLWATVLRNVDPEEIRRWVMFLFAGSMPTPEQGQALVEFRKSLRKETHDRLITTLYILEENQKENYTVELPSFETPVIPALPMVEPETLARFAARKGLTVAELEKAADAWTAAKTEASGRVRSKPHAKLNARDLSGPQVVAVIEDSTLGRLHRRYTELLATVELPTDGLKRVEQARAAARLCMTFDNLQARRAKLGLGPLPKDDRVTEARRLNVAFYRGRKAQLAKASL